MIYADIIIDISSDKLDRSFQYRVPERLEKKIKAGMVAAIPFGNAGRVRKGYVIGLSDKPKIAPEKIKEISEICSGEETTESRLIALAAWMRENYGSTMIQYNFPYDGGLSGAYPGENQGKRKKIYMPGYFRRGGNAVAERT